MLAVQTCCAASSEAVSQAMTGSWTVDASFPNGEKRSFRFDARSSGEGSLLLLDPRSSLAEPARPTDAKWTRGDPGSVTISGPVEFPIGNVGRERGTLVLRGKFGADGSITGEAAFYAPGQDPSVSKAKPSRSGSFKAVQKSGGGRP